MIKQLSIFLPFYNEAPIVTRSIKETFRVAWEAPVVQLPVKHLPDPRIGDHFWYPGLGYGGYCFPKDVKALAAGNLPFGDFPLNPKAPTCAAARRKNSRKNARGFIPGCQAPTGSRKNALAWF